MQRLLSLIKLALGWPLSIIAIFFIIRFLSNNSSRISISIGDIDPILFTSSIVFFAIYFLLRSLVWKKIIEYFGHKINFSDNLYAWSFSEVKRYIPGNVWSFLSRASLFSEKKVEKRKVFLSLLFEFELIVFACAILSIPSIQFIVSQLKLNFLLSYAFTVLTIVGALAFIFNRRVKLGKLSRFLPPFTARQNFILLILTILSFAFFGLGSFLSAASIFNLRNLSPLVLIAFFNFSFLVGYISFITPMGLGVREAVITLGLSSVLGVYDAGALAIFTRVALVFSEMTFLTSVLSFTKQDKFFKLIKKFKWEAFLVIGIITYNLYFIPASILRYANYYTGRFDLGNMIQTIWNTSQGNIFQLTDPNGTQEVSRLASHADFILILLTPFYMIWSDPKVLIVIQAVVLSLGAVFVFLISKEVLKNKLISTVFGLAYLLYPAVQYVILYDFHSVALATTFLLATAYFMIKKNYLLFGLFLFLSAITKEDVWVISALFGAYIFWFHKKRLLGGTISAISLFIFYILIWHAIPSATGGQHFALSYYSDFGSTPSDVIKNVLFHPMQTIPLLFGKEQMDYIKQLFLPLGYFSIFAPIFLIFTIPDLLISLLSNNPQLHQIYYQYSSSVTPFVFISAIYGIKFISSKIKEISMEGFAAMIIIFSVISNYLIGPLPFDRHPSLDMFTKPLANKSVVDSYLSQIPDSSSIAASNNLGSHLSERREIFTIPMGINKADYVIFLLKVTDDPSYDDEKKTVSDMRANPNYRMIFEKDNFLVFQKD